MSADGVLTIFHRGTELPHYIIHPNWTKTHGSHIVISWADQTSGSSRSIIIGLDAVTSIVRSLPLIATFARRLGPPKEQST